MRALLVIKDIGSDPVIGLIVVGICAIVFIIWMAIDADSLSKFNDYGKQTKSSHPGRNKANARTRKRRALEKRLGMPHLSLYGASEEEMNELKKKKGIY